MNPLRIFLLAALILVFFGTEEADAKEPVWDYTVGSEGGYLVYSMAISADGEYIATGSGYGAGHVYLFDKDSDTPLWSYNTETYVWSVAISADGEYIAAGTGHNKVYLFHKDSSTPLWSYTTDDWVVSVAISADGEYIAAGSHDTKIYLFNKNSGIPLWNYTAEHSMQSVAISSDGEYIVAGSFDSKVYLFDKDSSTPLWNYGTGEHVFSVSISADGERIAAGSGVPAQFGYDGGHIHLLQKDDVTSNSWEYETEGDVRSVSMSSNGEYIVAGSLDKRIYFIKDQNEEPTVESYTTEDSVYSVAISADGEYAIAGSDDYNIYLFHNNNGSLLWNYTAEDTVRSVAISSDGEYLVAGSRAENPLTNVYLFQTPKPTATIDSISPSPSFYGTNVDFIGTGSDSEGTIVAYLWESSIDGELSTEEYFSSDELSIGNHTITFRVQDNEGDWSDNASESLFIFAYPVAIAGQDLTGSPGVPLQFSGAGTDEDGTVVLYEWDFDGDGIFDWSSTENGRELNIYNNEGTYTVTLRVTDNDGFTGTDTVEITISEKKVVVNEDDEGNVTVTVTEAEEDEDGIPSISLITSLILVVLLAIFRKK